MNKHKQTRDDKEHVRAMVKEIGNRQEETRHARCNPRSLHLFRGSTSMWEWCGATEATIPQSPHSILRFANHQGYPMLRYVVSFQVAIETFTIILGQSPQLTWRLQISVNVDG
jgi:hypothetical protein